MGQPPQSRPLADAPAGSGAGTGSTTAPEMVPGQLPGQLPGTPDPVPMATALASVEDLQGNSPDLGWPEASSLADALVDTLSHLLVDVGSGAEGPSPRPTVIGAVGGRDGTLDAASCRATAASLRRAGRFLLDAGRHEGPSPWARGAGEVALDLADLLETAAHQARAGRLSPAHKGVLVRRLHAMRRALADL